MSSLLYSESECLFRKMLVKMKRPLMKRDLLVMSYGGRNGSENNADECYPGSSTVDHADNSANSGGTRRNLSALVGGNACFRAGNGACQLWGSSPCAAATGLVRKILVAVGRSVPEARTCFPSQLRTWPYISQGNKLGIPKEMFLFLLNVVTGKVSIFISPM